MSGEKLGPVYAVRLGLDRCSSSGREVLMHTGDGRVRIFMKRETADVHVGIARHRGWPNPRIVTFDLVPREEQN